MLHRPEDRKSPPSTIEFDASVLIAGGGLVGLCAAAFLAQHKFRSISIDRLTDSSPLPRAAFFHMRTLEMFRSLGIEEMVREASSRDFVLEGAIVALDCIAGHKLADIMPGLNEVIHAGERTSTLDLIKRYVLFAGPRGGSWAAAARALN